MKELSLLENKVQGQAPSGTVPSLRLSWKDSPSTQHLLDVISSIIAEEYITIAKQNPEVFINNTPRLSELRGCAPDGQGGAK